MRFVVLSITVALFVTACTVATQIEAQSKPNFVVIFVDDLGYGDLGCFGSKIHRTPHVDQMAKEGMKFTSFYVTSGVCTPSRASLLTGCYPRRVDMHVDAKDRLVLFPLAKKGLNPKEITIAEILKEQGYQTACIGKWHLGDHVEFLPTKQGFDYYYGIPYSNNMAKSVSKHWKLPLPLIQNEIVIEAPIDQKTMTKRFTEEAVKFITSNKNKPFFLYLPHAMVHSPHFSSEQFSGKSKGGKYGDAVEEVDWSTGQILKALKELDLDKKTLVVFTSDNGATSKGSNAPLSGGKGTTLEGGMRVPCVVRWPGKIPANKVCDEVVSTMDLLPTFSKLSGGHVPQDRVIDGKDIWHLLSNKKNATSPHEVFYYYYTDQLQAVRHGKWKLVVPLKIKKRMAAEKNFLKNTPLQLFDLDQDLQEKNNLADKHPDIVKKLMIHIRKAQEDLGDEAVQGKHQRKAGFVENPQVLKSN